MAERTDVDASAIWYPCWCRRSSLAPASPKLYAFILIPSEPSACRQVEEQAAKTTIKLIFPLVFFIFPSLFLVVLRSCGHLMMDSFKLFKEP